jgi:hypothetical protein
MFFFPLFSRWGERSARGHAPPLLHRYKSCTAAVFEKEKEGKRGFGFALGPRRSLEGYLGDARPGEPLDVR